jgi:ribosome biogenesis protein MAK21
MKVKAGPTSNKAKYPMGKKAKGHIAAASAAADGDAELRQEVLALGGDEEDLELIKDVEAGGGKEDKDESFSAKARQELEDFIKNLGLDKKFRQEQIVQEEEEEEEEEEEDREDDEMEDASADDEHDGDDTKDDGDLEEKKEEKKPSMAVQVEEVSSSTNDQIHEGGKKDKKTDHEFNFLKDKTGRQFCLIKSPSQPWHTILPDCHQDDFEKTSVYWLSKLEKYAAALMEQECQNFQKNRQKGIQRSEMGFIDTVLKSGAVGDRISALTVLLQESPVQNLHALDSLIGMVSLKSRRPCFMAMEALRDLFLNYLLSTERRLRLFKENPFCKLSTISGGNKDTRDKCILLWWFEHKLKESFGNFLTALDEISKDTIAKTRMDAMDVVFALLCGNPERENELLEKLVNKLGDPVRSVAANAMRTLTKLLDEHPVMKIVVLKEVERLLYRPNVSVKAQYYGICFLSQVRRIF